MTIINPKSISGITSITTASGADNLLTVHTNNTTERVRINNDGDVIVGSGITVSPDGDIFATGVTTATTFSGSGASLTNLPAANITGTLPAISGANLTSLPAANLTGTLPAISGANLTSLPAQATIANNSDNRVITGGSGVNLNGEANLTFGSDLLNISSTTSALGLRLTNTGNEYTNIQFSAARTGADNALGILNAKWNNTHEVAAIYLTAGDDTTNKDDGKIKFYTSAASGSLANRMEILNDGNVKVTDGDLVIGTSGHGIDFSATSNSGGTTASELLDDYETGIFTPNVASGGSVTSYSHQKGAYTKVGRLVTFNIYMQINGSGNGDHFKIGGLPFTAGSSLANDVFGGAWFSYDNNGFQSSSVLMYIPTANSTINFHLHSGGNFNGNAANVFGNRDFIINGFYYA